MIGLLQHFSSGDSALRFSFAFLKVSKRYGDISTFQQSSFYWPAVSENTCGIARQRADLLSMSGVWTNSQEMPSETLSRSILVGSISNSREKGNA